MKKKRIDVLLAEKGFFPTRERAQAALMAGIVLADGRRIEKPGDSVAETADIKIIGNDLPYVSRGGLKLEKALDVFALDLTGKIMVDIGASTGGFTDCALKRGARRVYAIDVGYGQLDWKLRSDGRVVNMERVNARYLSAGRIRDKADFAAIDVSFISLSKILPALKTFLAQDGAVVALVKPQFEAGRECLGKNGVVRDPTVHKRVLAQSIKNAQENGFAVTGLDFSPIKGPRGNIEYLLCLRAGEGDFAANIDEVVKLAHINAK
ncbi:MAG: TlyA family RNA methyltransferase [Acidaminococcales bacterium]|jgi:23S rRNA (cytidine1920-2'-O)/16S rRNA (cytidine1409-2'-O)-methyltransferase|nr:TlyA family RNA methyltransferase [Acidaminococcales bacterium]